MGQVCRMGFASLNPSYGVGMVWCDGMAAEPSRVTSGCWTINAGR